MYLSLLLLLLPLMGEWQVAVADCEKACHDYNGTYYEPCRNRTIDGNKTIDNTGTGTGEDREVTIVKCNEDMVFSGTRMWFELPDGVTDIIITQISLSGSDRFSIGRLICSSESECYTITLTSDAEPSILIRLKVSVFKIQFLGIQIQLATLVFRAVCERQCAKMKMPQNGRLMKRIVNGAIAEAHEYPFMARLEMYYSKEDRDYNQLSGSSIMSSNNKYSDCGGSIIHKNWILTAAHCVLLKMKEDNIDYYLMGVNVFLGDHYTNVTETEQRTRWVKPKDVHPHKDYNLPTAHNNDIALLKVASIEPDEDFRYPICLAPLYMDKLSFLDDCNVASAGWGVFDILKPNVGSVCLRKGFFTVENNGVCAAKWWALVPPTTITDRMICSTAPITNICYGDSGGPVFCKDRYKTFLQVGVNSFNARDPITFWKHNFPQVGARVTRYIGWITGIIFPDTLP